MIGNADYAAAIESFDFMLDEWDDPTVFPEGFIHLGTGGFRIAMLGPDGLVYKREIGGIGMNRTEAETFAKWGHKTNMLDLAECNMIGEVLVMRYVRADGTKCSKVCEDAMKVWARNLGLMDILSREGMNWFTVNSRPVLIDYSM